MGGQPTHSSSRAEFPPQKVNYVHPEVPTSAYSASVPPPLRPISHYCPLFQMPVFMLLQEVACREGRRDPQSFTSCSSSQRTDCGAWRSNGVFLWQSVTLLSLRARYGVQRPERKCVPNPELHPPSTKLNARASDSIPLRAGVFLLSKHAMWTGLMWCFQCSLLGVVQGVCLGVVQGNNAMRHCGMADL